MATGIYGTVRPADVSPQDVEIFYTFSPDRTTENLQVFTLNPLQVLQKFDHPEESGRILGGLYNLKLPSTIFNTKGFYDIYIRPKEIKLRILDCGILSSEPNIRGVIFNLQNVPSEDLFRFENGGLVGYRLEYLNTDPDSEEKKTQNIFRIISSNNRVEPISENITNTTQKGIRYRLNNNSNLIFCEVTPSSASNINPNVQPFIGLPNQEVILINTFFTPIHKSIELVEHDFDTIATLISGNRTKSVQDGILTIYNSENEIYKQFDEFDIKDDQGTETLYEVRRERNDIDFTKDFDSISNP